MLLLTEKVSYFFNWIGQTTGLRRDVFNYIIYTGFRERSGSVEECVT